MPEMSLTEIFGYIASMLVALSFTMKDITRLRIVNCVGCLLFTGYGIMIDSWPVILTNGFIAGVNICYLAKSRLCPQTT
ncbi:YgjV family protein [Vibrio quintilis]|uniref:Bacterial inner membrane protein n=1 Tax=Vibrio quintilis TaxID=1117707 RepID=A0A1M7YQN9_9VIBR|nr:YgjV family protein [Vibrio quintilis]SHO54942.1 hypothetical protein VQ7734_00661 [Vibrio quintilis]